MSPSFKEFNKKSGLQRKQLASFLNELHIWS